MPFSLRLTSGAGDAAARMVKIRKAVKTTEADLLYAGQRQRTRIIDRTDAGVDVDGEPFAPYSTKGPYYFYPNAHMGTSKSAIKTRKNAVRRILKITQGYADYAFEKGLTSVGGVPTREGLGIRFESYADAHASLGRAGVDLFSIGRGPHMMQGLIVKAEGESDLRIGIYGEAAARAAGHNTGTKTLPKRRFMGASAADVRQMAQDIYARISARLKALK